MRILLALLVFFVSKVQAQVAAEGTLAVAPTDVKSLEREENQLLQRHQPFYFAYGEPTSKLQLSFKSPIIRGVPLYFGYTQLMFWALSEKSKPFRDLTYNPELFYRYEIKGAGWLNSVDFGFWSHTSNGKEGIDSRSLNKNYARFNFEREGRKWTTRAGLQIANLYDFDSTNADIQNYIGSVAFSLSFIQLYEAWFDKSELALQVAPGGKFSQRVEKGGYQVSWSFRLGAINLVPAFYLQYYRGYAETLLNYNDEVSEFRGGVVF